MTLVIPKNIYLQLHADIARGRDLVGPIPRNFLMRILRWLLW